MSSFRARVASGRRGVFPPSTSAPRKAVRVRGTLRRGKKRVRGVALRVRPGRHRVRLPGKALKPGRDSPTLRAGESADRAFPRPPRVGLPPSGRACGPAALAPPSRGGRPARVKPDDERELTARGERQASAAGAALARLGVEFAAIYTSPKVRGVDTAKLAAEALNTDPEVEDVLGNGFDRDDASSCSAVTTRARVLVVGHDPSFTQSSMT